MVSFVQPFLSVLRILLAVQGAEAQAGSLGLLVGLLLRYRLGLLMVPWASLGWAL